MKLLFAVALMANLCQAQSPLVTGVGNFIHNVKDLDASVHFYRDILGLDMPRPPGDWQDTEAVLRLYDAVGGQFRVATAQVAASPMRIELAEFKGIEQKPLRVEAALGAIILVLTVPALEPILERLNKPGRMPPIPSPPVLGKGFIVFDPDGFVVQLVAAEEGARANLSVRLAVRESGEMETLFSSVGLHQVASKDFEVRTQGFADPFHIGLMRVASATMTRPLRPRDPGAGVLRLLVADIDAAVKALTEAGAKVASTAGAIQTLPGNPGRRAAILRTQDGHFIQVLQ